MTVRRPLGADPASWPELLLPAEVAQLAGVEPKTVQRWAVEGRLRSVRTLGGHRRFPRAAVLEALERARAGRP